MGMLYRLANDAQTNNTRGHPLTDRDLTVLSFFGAIRFATTGQLAAAFVPHTFPIKEKLRRRLRTLAQMGYLDRPAWRIAREREQEFVLTDEARERGRPQDVWALAQRGAEILEMAEASDWNRNNGRLRH